MENIELWEIHGRTHQIKSLCGGFAIINEDGR